MEIVSLLLCAASLTNALPVIEVWATPVTQTESVSPDGAEETVITCDTTLANGRPFEVKLDVL